MQFLSTPSARRATHTIALDDRTDDISIHALREEGDRKQRGDDHAHDHISIHALREEGDPTAWWPLLTGTYFYPRPPRGGRRGRCLRHFPPRDFYPRPPRGGRRMQMPEIAARRIFLSTPSARRATWRVRVYRVLRRISIHALREEGDLRASGMSPMWKKFLSTPSARRATDAAAPRHPVCRISIHALREEGDRKP